MGKHDDERSVFPLTSLQIGDLQSYLSDLSLFLAPESNKFYILVDNRPWLRDLGSRPAHLWQLMVTKSRLSPFANTKGRRARKDGKEASSKSNAKDAKKLERWFSLVDAAMLSKKRILLPVKTLKTSSLLSNELHRTLYGFIVFEVSWSNVRGLNYLNELQTDTSLAIEAKFMRRWEFDSIDQAAKCLSSWFSGTLLEQRHLKEYLNSTIGEVFYDAEKDFPRSIPFDDDENICGDSFSIEEDFPHDHCGNFRVYPGTVECDTSEPHTPPPTGPYKRRKVTRANGTGVEVDAYCEETRGQAESSLGNSNENAVEATEYRDVLILFRFDDRDLPFKLQQIIMPDLRLLHLLEAGLPSWVIFLQSYPGFCHIYRPWMCPLARALYVLISIITVLIGFYDLYKNVPVLKATASRLCGPLFDWIETWEMVSRIKYLGTMLFLHNFQKAVEWFLTATHATRSFFSVLYLPLAEPFMECWGFLLPIWNMFSELVECLFSVIWTVFGSLCSLMEDLIEVLLRPIWFIGLVLWNIVTSILYPIFWILWEILFAPIRLVLALSSIVAFVCGFISDLVGDIWRLSSSIIQLASASEATVSSTYEVSVWRSLWNDLFSQVFRAVRSILNGFVAFFTACNRHRLSIYNHVQDVIQRRFGGVPRSQTSDPRRSKSTCGNQCQSEVRRRVHSKNCSPATLSF
ncbi:uncharacterized protein LOC105800214 [Gossypium raimondii]|uniref:Uncharacterized protein n=2 Tax=Gossypium raimondii TaxID=29730 RepID=A0A0D2PTY2_GOSRA|nr:uncharacterized protein LOC105800214 [Gossypium raimondii]KJB10324.1 hypothetical protein B456_001G196200 [Gossypium raimondii]KJB10327.1 hypothetical protein B456_001G196200 [Gossypium raimondii]